MLWDRNECYHNNYHQSSENICQARDRTNDLLFSFPVPLSYMGLAIISLAEEREEEDDNNKDKFRKDYILDILSIYGLDHELQIQNLQ